MALSTSWVMPHSAAWSTLLPSRREPGHHVEDGQQEVDEPEVDEHGAGDARRCRWRGRRTSRPGRWRGSTGGPMPASRASRPGLVASDSIVETPPSIHSVMPRTGMPWARATNEWASSWASTETKNSKAATTETDQSVVVDQTSTCEPAGRHRPRHQGEDEDPARRDRDVDAEQPRYLEARPHAPPCSPGRPRSLGDSTRLFPPGAQGERRGTQRSDARLSGDDEADRRPTGELDDGVEAVGHGEHPGAGSGRAAGRRRSRRRAGEREQPEALDEGAVAGRPPRRRGTWS